MKDAAPAAVTPPTNLKFYARYAQMGRARQAKYSGRLEEWDVRKFDRLEVLARRVMVLPELLNREQHLQFQDDLLNGRLSTVEFQVLVAPELSPLLPPGTVQEPSPPPTPTAISWRVSIMSIPGLTRAWLHARWSRLRS